MGAGKGRARRAQFVSPVAGHGPPSQYSSSQYHQGEFSGIYADPTSVLKRGKDGAIDAVDATWEFADGGEVTFKSITAPLNGPEPAAGHDVFTDDGAWIGADSSHPHLRFTPTAAAALSARQAERVIAAYEGGDYGEGEAGFAVYKFPSDEGGGLVREQVSVWLIDDAVRSPEGDPPLRDPVTSPGPLTVLTPEDY